MSGEARPTVSRKASTSAYRLVSRKSDRSARVSGPPCPAAARVIAERRTGTSSSRLRIVRCGGTGMEDQGRRDNVRPGGIGATTIRPLHVHSGPVYLAQCTEETGGQSGRDADDSRETMGPGSPPAGPIVRLVHERLVYRREVMRTPIRALAEEIGISKSGVDHFYRRRAPGKNWPRLRDWYMGQRAREREEY